ncbi:MAG: hypothetical protein COY42_14555 [Armatimonadetes bacterium CG_4_10_14_0_8_um_filter_66_14]|nr:hypothetical protein [Armatimonadota bacterium]OIO98426.1 MAG: hypothetical protein AUJ96_21205 [Armatimonadetes bacterium CG2_30_66_41]PIU87641.1 MAG: hypothetical protein COS65_33595 [Armatimonadetes bacterium CG06_land_8_20_14_3_00_66_21]PIZ44167.1 MAG: hypothetical protein COY42_14555 [Armatimonadetes bacterium CG_4_10_14_0_8_um_filter_66_14]
MKSFTCWRVRQALAASEELLAGKQRFVDEHLTRCPECARERRWLRLTQDSLAAQRSVSPPADFTRRAMARFAATPRHRPAWAVLPLVPQLAQVGVALALFHVGTSALRRPATLTWTPPAPSTTLAAPADTTGGAFVQDAGRPQLAATSSPVAAAFRSTESIPVRERTPRQRVSRRETRVPGSRVSIQLQRVAPAPTRTHTQGRNDADALIRSSTALMAEREYLAALTRCQEAAERARSQEGRQRARELAGQLHAASGDTVLEQALLQPAAFSSGREAPAVRGTDPVTVATQCREVQRALRKLPREQRSPQTLMALATACEALAERASAVEAYAQIVERFPNAEESRTAAQRLAQLS